MPGGGLVSMVWTGFSAPAPSPLAGRLCARRCCKWKTCGDQSFDLTWKQECMLNDSASRYCPHTPDNKQIVLLQNHEPCFPLHPKICPSWKWLQLPHKNMAPNNIAASPVWRARINTWFLPSCHPSVSDALLCAMYYSSEMNGCSPLSTEFTSGEVEKWNNYSSVWWM